MEFAAKHKSGQVIEGSKSNTIVSFDSGTNKPLFAISFLSIPKLNETPSQNKQTSPKNAENIPPKPHL